MRCGFPQIASCKKCREVSDDDQTWRKVRGHTIVEFGAFDMVRIVLGEAEI
jgi:hypothetical protein